MSGEIFKLDEIALFLWQLPGVRLILMMQRGGFSQAENRLLQITLFCDLKCYGAEIKQPVVIFYLCGFLKNDVFLPHNNINYFPWDNNNLANCFTFGPFGCGFMGKGCFFNVFPAGICRHFELEA